LVFIDFKIRLEKTDAPRVAILSLLARLAYGGK